MAANHLGHFQLTTQLLGLAGEDGHCAFADGGRVVVVASSLHRMPVNGINIEQPMYTSPEVLQARHPSFMGVLAQNLHARVLADLQPPSPATYLSTCCFPHLHLL